MANRVVRNMSAAALLAVCSMAMGIETGPVNGAAEALLRTYPGARVHQEGGRVKIIYGVPMTGGATADEAAAAWLAQHAGAFDVGQLQVAEEWVVPLKDNQFTVFTYKQFIGGVPVEFGMLKILVLNAPAPRVVLASGNLAKAPGGGLGAPAIDGAVALANAKKLRSAKGMTIWSEPELVVFQGNGDWIDPVLTWKVSGESPNVADQLCMTYFINARTGELAFARNEVQHTDVNGTVQGKATPGLFPDVATNPPVLMPVPSIKVGIAGGATAFTNDVGVFNLVNPGTTAVTVNSGVGTASGYGGQWVNVVPTSGAALLANSGSVLPPGPADMTFNNTPSEATTAQINSFIGTSKTHNYFKSRAPAFTGLDVVLRCNTGVSGTCNAFFQAGSTPPSSSSINFYNTGGGCPNTAYSTVISHEYGHFIVNRLNLAQNAFGEGFGDTMGSMVWDSQGTGQQFFLNSQEPLRDPIVSNIQYPCAQPIHTCGMVLSGFWWRTRQNMGAFYGSQQGLDLTRNLNVAWAVVTTGGPNSQNSAGPTTAIEVLTVDDNDGNINNGTPNYSRICPAFAAHNIQCPQLQLLNFEYPSGRPASIPASQPFALPVNITGNAAQPVAGTGTLSYRVGNVGSYTTVPMTQGAPNQYTATLPATPCGNVLYYYVGSQTTSNITATDPMNAPTSVHSTIVGTIQNTSILSVDFNNALPAGWAATGQWHITAACPPGGTACAGSQAAYYGTDAACTYQTGSTTNNGTLTSPQIQLPPAVPGGSLTLSYCSALITENAASYDKATVLINGTEVDRAPESANWSSRQINLAAYAGQTVTLTFKFDTVDGVNNNFRGWHVDNVAITASTIACNTCYANCDGSTTQPILNVNDFLCFQTKYAQGDPYANCDGSTAVPILNVNDFLCFQTRYAQGCP